MKTNNKKILRGIFLLAIGMLTLVTNGYAQEEGFVIDPNVVFVDGAEGVQKEPAICFGDTNYVVVWRNSKWRVGWNETIGISGTRVSQSSTGSPVLDPARIIISQPSMGEYGSSIVRTPAVCLGDTSYIVVWGEGFPDEFGDVYDYDLYASRVSLSGELLDTTSIIVSNGVRYQYFPAVAFDGTNWFVVWKDERDGSEEDDIYGARVSQSGEVLDPDGIAISTAGGQQWYPEIAFDGTNYLVVWQSNYEGYVYGTRVSQAGEVLDPAGITIPGGYGHTPSVAFDGTNYLVVYMQWGIRGARVDTSGALLDPGGFIISTGLQEGWQLNPSVSFNGTNYFVAWEDYWREEVFPDIYGSLVSPSGQVLIPTIPIAIADFKQMNPVVASEGSDWLVVWSDRRPEYIGEICGSRIDSSGTVLNPEPNAIVISTGGNEQKFSSTCFDGTNYFVVWNEWRGHGSYDIYCARVDQSGVIIDTTIAIPTAAYFSSYPGVASSGTNYFVVWSPYSPQSVCGTRISQSGEILDPDPILLAIGGTSEFRPSVCFGGGIYLAVWLHGCSSISGARVTQSGVVLDPEPITIASGLCSAYRAPSVCFDGTNFFVVFEGNDDVHGTWVSLSGEVLNHIVIAPYDNHFPNPQVSFDGTNYLVVWENKRSGVNRGIYCARVSQSGVVLDPGGILITTTESGDSPPSVSFDGTDFVVAWEDDGNICGSLVSPSGVVIDSFEICTQPYRQFWPDMVSGPDEKVLITWSGWTPTINDQPANTYRIWGKLYPFNVGIEEEVVSTTEAFKLYQNYPNPFNPTTTIKFNTDITEKNTELIIYNIKGQKVKTLVNEKLNTGMQQVIWNGKDEKGKSVSSGIYFYKLDCGDYTSVRKMILMK